MTDLNKIRAAQVHAAEQAAIADLPPELLASVAPAVPAPEGAPVALAVPRPFDAVKSFANGVLKMLDERIEVAARASHPFMDKFGDHPETIVAAKAQASELREVRNQVRILGDRALVDLMKFRPAAREAAPAQTWRADYPASEAELSAEREKARADERMFGLGATVNGWHVPAHVVSIYRLSAAQSPAEGDDLPPLPPATWPRNVGTPSWTFDEVREYARAAVLASQAQPKGTACAMTYTPVWKEGAGGLPYQESNFGCTACGYVGRHDSHPGCRRPPTQAPAPGAETDDTPKATAYEYELERLIHDFVRTALVGSPSEATLHHLDQLIDTVRHPTINRNLRSMRRQVTNPRPPCPPFASCRRSAGAEIAAPAVGATWTPTAENINALPQPVRDYIHALASNCDPAGTVADNTIKADLIRELQASNRRIRDELDTPGNRWPEARFAGYTGQPYDNDYTADQAAAFDEGKRARVGSQPPVQHTGDANG